MRTAVDHVHHRHRAASPHRRRRDGGRAARPRRPPPWRPRARPRGSRSRRGGPCSACRRDRSARGRGTPGRAHRVRAPRRRSRRSRSRPPARRPCRPTPRRRPAARPPRGHRSTRRTGRSPRPIAPESSETSTSTVGLPRESRTWRPRTSVIVVIPCLLCPVVIRVLLVERERRPVLAVGGRERAPRLRRARGTASRRARSSSSGSTSSLRATFTAANSTSPSSERPRVGLVSWRARPRQLGAQLAQLVVEVGEGAREIGVLEADRPRAHAAPSARTSSAGSALGHVVEDPVAPLVLALDGLPALANARRRSSPRRRRTRADAARRASRDARAAVSRSPAPRSSSRSARKYDWKSRSPISSSSFASSPANAASATS